jgi:hypothetical protein
MVTGGGGGDWSGDPSDGGESAAATSVCRCGSASVAGAAWRASSIWSSSRGSGAAIAAA